MSSIPAATAAYRSRRNDVLVSVAADGVTFASLPIPLSAAEQLHRALGQALSLAGIAAESPTSDEQKHNRSQAATTLLAEIEEWTARTGTPEGSIGHKLFLHPGFVGLLRKRLTLSHEKELAVRAFLTGNPDGWAGELPKTHGNGTRPVYRSSSPRVRLPDAPVYVSRDACPRCGVRADIGCPHTGAPLGTSF